MVKNMGVIGLASLFGKACLQKQISIIGVRNYRVMEEIAMNKSIKKKENKSFDLFVDN